LSKLTHSEAAVFSLIPNEDGAWLKLHVLGDILFSPYALNGEIINSYPLIYSGQVKISTEDLQKIVFKLHETSFFEIPIFASTPKGCCFGCKIYSLEYFERTPYWQRHHRVHRLAPGWHTALYTIAFDLIKLWEKQEGISQLPEELVYTSY